MAPDPRVETAFLGLATSFFMMVVLSFGHGLGATRDAVAIAALGLSGCAATGWWLMGHGAPRLGQAALAVGVVFGATGAGALSRAYQLGDDGFAGWAALAAGALAMAHAVRGQGLGWLAAFALVGAAEGPPAAIGWAMPFAFLFGLGALAYRTDSRGLLVAAAVGTFGSALMQWTWGAHALLGVDVALMLGALGWRSWHARYVPYHALREAMVAHPPGRIAVGLRPPGAAHWAVATWLWATGLAISVDGHDLVHELAHVSPPALLALGATALAAAGVWAATARTAASPAEHLSLGVAALGAAAACVDAQHAGMAIAAGVAAAAALAAPGGGWAFRRLAVLLVAVVCIRIVADAADGMASTILPFAVGGAGAACLAWLGGRRWSAAMETVKGAQA